MRQLVTTWTLFALLASASFAQSVNVNFGPDATLDDVTYPEFSGYVGDDGSPYGERENGLTYGWMDGTGAPDTQSQTRNRNNGASADERYDTLNHVIKGDAHSWQIDLDNGDYDIKLVSGDPNHTDQQNDFSITGGDAPLDLIDPSGAGDNFDEFLFSYSVTQGYLRLSPLPADNLDLNQKVSFIEITAVPEPVSMSLTLIGVAGAMGILRRRRR